MAYRRRHCLGLVVELAGIDSSGLVLLFYLYRYSRAPLIMNFIRKFILPKEVDFDSALQAQARITRIIVSDLHTACIDDELKNPGAVKRNCQANSRYCQYD